MQSHRNQFKQHSDIRYVMDSSITIIFFMILGMKRSLSLTVGSFFLEISNELVMIRLRGGSLICFLLQHKPLFLNKGVLFSGGVSAG